MRSAIKILHLHIPKTGGSTLNKYIYHQWRSKEHRVDENGYLHSGIYYYPYGFFSNSGATVPVDVQRTLSSTELRAVVGHFRFGLHQYVTSPWTYVTLLRHPVERIISLYYHLKLEDHLSLAEFVESDSYIEVDNDQTRRLYGAEQGPFRRTNAILNKAKQNLRRYFSVVGITERFDETLLLVKRTFGWNKELLYFLKNVNRRRPSTVSLSTRTLDAIRARNQLDFELYEFANRLLDESISAYDQSYFDELEDYRQVKRITLKNKAAQRTQHL